MPIAGIPDDAMTAFEGDEQSAVPAESQRFSVSPSPLDPLAVRPPERADLYAVEVRQRTIVIVQSRRDPVAPVGYRDHSRAVR